MIIVRRNVVFDFGFQSNFLFPSFLPNLTEMSYGNIKHQTNFDDRAYQEQIGKYTILVKQLHFR